MPFFFARNASPNETWAPLLEKAFAKAHGDFASLSGGWVGEGFEDLSGGVTTELLASDTLDVDTFWATELSRVNDEFLFGCSTVVFERGYGSCDGISEGHDYIIMEARTLKNGQRLVKLRNPWGRIREGLWTGAWSDGSKEWTAEVQIERGHVFGSDSVFWIAYEDLLHKYTHLERTRLFREPDWRCGQRWVAADVPWRPSWNEKFRIKVANETPLVLVLSQLNERYFRGLEGQYRFFLNFRLHEKDRPEPEEYIARSHGNYIMNRSVAVELPSVLPGEYSVFVRITAIRIKSYKSVEDVVQAETYAREENNKLAAVGAAYDLAHSKAYAHMQAVKQARKMADYKKASGAREAERTHQWEKRDMGRDSKLQPFCLKGQGYPLILS